MAAQALARPRRMGGRNPQGRIGENRLEEPREARSPCPRPLIAGDEILPDLDQRVGEAPPGCMAIDRVSRQRAIIGLVVADDEALLGAQAGKQGIGEAGVEIPKDSGMPGPRPAAPDGGKAVDSDQARRRARADRALDRRPDGRVVGVVEAGDAAPRFRPRRPARCRARRRRRKGASPGSDRRGRGSDRSRGGRSGSGSPARRGKRRARASPRRRRCRRRCGAGTRPPAGRDRRDRPAPRSRRGRRGSAPPIRPPPERSRPDAARRPVRPLRGLRRRSSVRGGGLRVEARLNLP